uniref:Selenocysteine-specific elongation factor n=1 Tax=candidate division WOR-3 bacterium TaxID=2052148 RepID=A0A7C3UQ03_UNCW3
MHCVIGTCGHIDHGKTALVTALTGYNPDRLKEEKERGMTTDLGFAFYGDSATIIDVPGHEKFIRHMIAGAHTVDLVLLVVAANEGVRLQTTEHFEITKLLGIKRGIIVITKIDLVDKETLYLVQEEVRNLVRGSYLASSPIVFVSSLTGEGIETLRGLIDKMIEETPPKEDRGYFRCHVDRSFRIKGFGQVVAGTILSGSVRVGDTLEVAPKGFLVRVRGLQRHKKEIEKAEMGERVAINILGQEKEEIIRGDVLIEPKSLEPTHFFSGYVTLLRNNSIKRGKRFKLHIGTKETLARIYPLFRDEIPPGESDYCQIFTEEMIVCEIQDPFILRSFSPPMTIGGGKVLEVCQRKVKRGDASLLSHLSRLNSPEKKVVVYELVNSSGFHPISEKEIGRRAGLTNLKEILSELREEGKIKECAGYITTTNYEKAKEKIKSIISDYHKENPYKTGIRYSELISRLAQEMAPPLREKVLQEVIEEGVLVMEKETIKLSGFQISLTEEEKGLAEKVVSFLKGKGFMPPDEKELIKHFAGEKRYGKVIGILKETGDLIEIGGFLFPRETVERAKEILVSLLTERKEITPSEYRERLNTTRRYVIPLLNYFDSSGITIRKGDLRILKRSTV